MFRTVCKSYRLFNGLAISSCRFGEPAVGLRADDVTKFTTGILHRTYRESHQHHHQQQKTAAPQVPSTHSLQCTISSPLYHQHHRHHHQPQLHPSYPVLTNVNYLALCQPSTSSTSSSPAGLCTVLQTANYSTGKDGSKPQSAATPAAPKEGEGEGEEQLSIFKRFKRAYKEHGKILVGVHTATSIVWYGSFYAIASGGFDIVPYLEQWGFSDTIINPFRAGGLGDFAVAYLMYKLATPARYTVTIGGTNFVIRYLRKTGHMAPKSQEDSLREFYKEGRDKLKNSKLRQERLKRLRAARDKRKAAGKGTKK